MNKNKQHSTQFNINNVAFDQKLEYIQNLIRLATNNKEIQNYYKGLLNQLIEVEVKTLKAKIEMQKVQDELFVKQAIVDLTSPSSKKLVYDYLYNENYGNVENKIEECSQHTQQKESKNKSETKPGRKGRKGKKGKKPGFQQKKQSNPESKKNQAPQQINSDCVKTRKQNTKLVPLVPQKKLNQKQNSKQTSKQKQKGRKCVLRSSKKVKKAK